MPEILRNKQFCQLDIKMRHSNIEKVSKKVEAKVTTCKEAKMSYEDLEALYEWRMGTSHKQ